MSSGTVTKKGFAGKNTLGRKSDLLQRSLYLLKEAQPEVLFTIQELYKNQVQDQNQRSQLDLPPKETSSNGKDQSASPQAALQGQDMDNSGYRSSSSRSSSRSSSSRHEYNHSSSRTSTSSSSRSSHPSQAPSVTPSGYVCDPKMYDSLKTGLQIREQSSTYPTHPGVTFKRLPFYDHLGDLLKPTTIMTRNPPRCIEEKGVKKQISEAYFVFNLTAGQAQEIAMSRDLRPQAKIEYTVQVQMRFCLIDTAKEQDDCFPNSICVRVNGKMAPLPNPIPSNRPGVEPKRPSRPVSITSLCRLSPTVPNRIDVSWASESGKAHCIKVDLVKRVTSEVLMARLRNKGVRPPDHTRAMIKQKMTSEDNDIALDTLKVSIQCPLSRMRISTPCRPTTCSHVQVFDAMMFLQMNERKATWVCPVCDGNAHFDVLSLDGYFQEVVNAAAPDVSDINLSEDGSWEPFKPGKKDSSRGGDGGSSSKASSNRSSPAVSTTSNLATSSIPLPTSSAPPPPPPSASNGSSTNGGNGATNGNEGGTKRKVVAVDLTLSDSDDDEASKPPPSKRPATSSSNPTSSSHPTHNQTPPTNHHVASQQQPQQQQLQQQPTQSGSSRSHPYPVTGPTPVALTANQSHYLPVAGMPLGYSYAPTTGPAISTSTTMSTAGYPSTTPYRPSSNVDLNSPQNLMQNYLAIYSRNGNDATATAPPSSTSSRAPRSSSDVVTLD